MILTLLQVALGGAIGSACRFLIGLGVVRLIPSQIPLGVLSVNVIGSFLMGAFVVWSFQKDAGALNPFVMTGLLGGFTTFSAFSLETVTLFERGQIGMAMLYVALSVGLSVVGLAIGVAVARGIWA